MKNIAYSLLPLDGYYTFSQRFLELLKAASSGTFDLAAVISPLGSVFLKFEAAYKKERKSEYTAKLAAADEARDRAYLALRHYLVACSYASVEGYSAAADTLLTIFSRLGWSMQKAGYQTESSRLGNLIAELQTDENVALLTTAEATPWLERMMTAADAFEAIYQQKLATDAADDTISAYRLRKVLQQQIEISLSWMDVQQQFNKSDELTTLIGQVNELIANTMTAARASATRKSSAEEE
ncbi:DUF6261 family protein [Prolixibacter sp. SD074]|jgi:hypothetical protein|uniref:DUF6261 family protein n=1 Tax=Prolixibacter sp. SD074 TaxID=2652391 RepID=UPI00127977DF|nr:DUF6261 family protein [Prolixibacter sp. SD074]GET28117.1 hypothetical protein SD074_03190 [Prolixibacter sp. SD074]